MDELGQTLREARVARGMSLEDIAYATKIPRGSIAHLEAGRFDALPAPVFIRGFIRAYARTVNLDPNPLIRAFEAQVAPATTPKPEVTPKQQVSAIERRLDPSRKLVPLQPISARPQTSFRGGFMVLAAVAAGLLLTAWMLVGDKAPRHDSSSAQRTTAPMLIEQVDGMPTFDDAPRRSNARIMGMRRAPNQANPGASVR